MNVFNAAELSTSKMVTMIKLTLCVSTTVKRASLVAQLVKNPPAMQEAQEMLVQSLGLEDPLKEEVATHSSTLAWKIPWTEEPVRLTVHGVAKSRTQLRDCTSLA